MKQIPQANGRVKLAIYESFREGARTRQRTVRSLGYLDELVLEHADPIAWGKAVAREMTRAKQSAERPVTIDIHPMQRLDKRTPSVKNIGSAVAFAYYSALGIGTTLKRAARTSSTAYSLDAVCRLLVLERLVDPGSKLSAWNHRERYFFRSPFSDDDVYRALDGLALA
ncbi:hypothetical protein K6V98_04815 [Collinsella sp. AGMB00827]|uniref:Transposase n=1 Tax=Collinsella ureilytica TaxID=2869515 RepID=A0ABS7MK82_9ACTN|nr:hypothetical protein [Collinsella urealyticum]MBY4797677.1 hypothetical protein [Collinsella urealyticum]